MARKKEKHAYIRPVHMDHRLISLALCKYDDPLVDEDIIAHFPPDEPGKDIKAMAVEYGHASSVECVHWASPIFIEE